jgi:hypothetical protein
MSNNFQLRDFGHCTVCGGRFGLVRYYSWQNAICSRKCAGRLKARRENDRRWLTQAMPIALSPDLSRGPDGYETYQGMSSLNL